MASGTEQAYPIDDAMTRALDMHKAGRLGEAQALYQRVLQARPNHPEALHFLGLLAHQRGKSDVAVSMIRQAIAAGFGGALAYYNLAEAYRALGQTEEAIASYRQALKADPMDSYAHFGLADVHYEAGDFDQAIDQYERALALEPDHPEMLNNLGNALLEKGETAAALSRYERALEIDPNYTRAMANIADVRANEDRDGALPMLRRAADAADEAETLVQIGRIFQRLDLPDEATACADRAIATDPACADAHLMRGNVLWHRGDFADAAKCYLAAAEARPDLATTHMHLASALVELRRHDEALAGFGEALRIDPDLAEAVSGRAYALLEKGEVQEAHREADRALAMDPKLASAHYHLGVCLQQMGRFDDAQVSMERARALNPDLGAAHFNLAYGEGQSGDEAEIERLEAFAADSTKQVRDRIAVHFALGRQYDGAKAYDRAFDHYIRGNALKRRSQPFDPETFESFVSTLIDIFTPEYFAAREGFGDPSELPVFVVGMPRSGSTLVEQIISAHPEAHGAGELWTMHKLIAEIDELLDVDAPFPACAADLDAEGAARLAAYYMNDLRRHAPDKRRITDKLPLNYLRAGLIAAILPGARIIHTMRDPIDICVSCFTQNFGRGLNFTNDLTDLGLYYRQYERLMAHWRAVLPKPMLDLPYEELVADQDAVSRRIVDFLGLDWDPAVLRFHDHDRPVQTASFWQVRQPIYKSSVEKWRRYESALGPLLEALGRDA
ncbi:MAG: tetratricopeptide repeat protein [Rhodospirillaceae bacterium]|nr:tetratricopeptide repeat protein [Rhodospirillaceae bacterium]